MSGESLGVEAARLVAAFQAALQGLTAGGSGTDGTPEATGSSGTQAHTGSECSVCPVCRGIAVLRQVRPEAVEHLALAVSDLAQAVRELVRVPATAPEADGDAVHAPAADKSFDEGRDAAKASRAAGSAGAARPADAVQHIPITD